MNGTLGRRAPVVVVFTLLLALLVAAPAHATVSISRAELDDDRLRIEGSASANRSITVDGVVMGSSDGDGDFRVERNGYSPPPDCTVDVNDGSSTPRTATLSGCTVSAPPTPPPPPAAPQITPQVDELGPGFVGSDFTTFSSTTSTLTFGPGALGPVGYEVITGQLPDGLQLVEQDDGSSPNKRVNATVTGTPTTVQTRTFTVEATDANGLHATRSYTIRINPASTLEITPQPWAPLAVGEFSNLWIDGIGGVRPYTWARTAGQLPPGMSLIQDNPNGPLVRVSGTPTTAGTFSFTLRLTDAQGATVNRAFSVTVPEPDTSAGPAAPTLLSPADGASVTTPFTIDWTEEFDPTLSVNGGYNWQVSTSTNFSAPVLRDSTLPTVTQDTISGIPAGTYYWQVQAVDGQLRSSVFSAPHSFVVTGSDPGALAAPVLAPLPFGTQYHPMEHFTFSWSAVAGASSYLVEADRDPTFPAPVEIRLDNITQTSDGLTIGGSLQGSWNLRVRAVGADGVVGTPSNVRTFTISYDAPVGPAPTLASPADGATLQLPITLDWNDVANPQSSGYEAQVATSPSFSDVEVQVSGQTSSQYELLSLSPGTHFWRVRHHQGDSSPTTSAPTAWSEVRSFTIGSGPVGVSSLWFGAPPCANPCPGADSLFSGQEIVVSLQLTAEAPAGGGVVAITSSNPSASGTHPSSVTVPAGFAYTQFRLFAGQVTTPTAVTLTATLGSSSDTFDFTVSPSSLKRLSFCCDSTGGLPAGAHLELTGQSPPGGLTVSLSSDSPLATPPASITVPAGSFSAPISIPTSEVTTTTTVTITATSNGGSVQAQLRLYPQQPPASLVLDRTSTTGTEGANGVVRIATGQQHEVQMRITSSHPDIARPQPYALIQYLGTAGSFNIVTNAPAVSTDVTISATGAGVTLTTTLTVHPVGGPPATLSTLNLNPTGVTGGTPSTGTVTLGGAAPPGGAAVALSSSNTAAATVPSSVTVPAGATTASFTVTSLAVASPGTATISATYGGTTRTAVLTVSPPATADTVAIQQAQYRSGRSRLTVEATSTSAGAVLRVYVTSTGVLVGTLNSDGGGSYSREFRNVANPQSITVVSSGGGTATRTVTTRR